jgi:hypothetical protein
MISVTSNLEIVFQLENHQTMYTIEREVIERTNRPLSFDTTRIA